MKNISDIFPSLEGYDRDVRSRRYLHPVKVLWKQGDVAGENNLLIPRTSQITLGDSAEPCTLTNKPGMPKSAILLDFGREFQGSARLLIWSVASANARANIRVRFGESAMEAMAELGEKNAQNDHASRDITMNVGFLSGNETNETGYRFLRIDLLDDDCSISFKAIQGVFIFRDIPYIGSFECNDELVNTIYNTAAYTAHLNMQEYLWDGIKRDRLVWIGDMQTEVMTIASVFGYNEVVPKSLDLIRDITPVGTWMNGISSYSIWWLFLHYDWYMSFGNLEYLNESRDYIIALVRLLSTLVKGNGSEDMPDMRFIDWPNQANSIATAAGLHGMLIMAMDKGMLLAKVLGDDETAEMCSRAKAKLMTYKPDPNGSKQAGAFLVCCGLEDAKRMNEKLLKVNGAHGFSTFLGYYTLAAMAMAEDYTGALDAMREYWGGMLKMGATTFWEDFNLDWMENAAPVDQLTPEGMKDIHGDYGAYCYVKFRHSLCHGWSSGPVPFLTRYILGVNVLEPGCRKISVIPHLGDLEYVKGVFPTPYGEVKVSAVKNGDNIDVDIHAPKEVKIVTPSEAEFAFCVQ